MTDHNRTTDEELSNADSQEGASADTSAGSEKPENAPKKAPPTSDKPLRPLRLWPGFVIPVACLATVFLPGFIVPGTMIQFLCMMLGPMVAILLTVIWWLFASRAPWADRLIMFGLFLIGAIVTPFFVHASMPMALLMFGWPLIVILFTGSWFASRNAAWPTRRLWAETSIVLGWAFMIALRCDGLDGQVLPAMSLRWSQTAEDRYLAELAAEEVKSASDRTDAAESTTDEPTAALTLTEGDWPGFRGPRRDGRVQIDAIETSRPPRELWRRTLGPGWSSFAVVGNRLFTQEQRGDYEVVLCLDADTGETVWTYQDETRFWETVGGAGPRATPTFHDGSIYALGANGNLCRLDASTGEREWARLIGPDGDAATPQWGFSSSPLIVDNVVVVFAGGNQGNSLIAYDKDTGQVAWLGGEGGHSYSSPHLAEIDGVRQILMVTEQGLSSLAPNDGAVLWSDAWPMPGYRVVQPSIVGPSILYGTNNGMGTRRLDVRRQDGDWLAVERWTSRGLKPYFNDFVVHKQSVYGFDNSILVCLDLETGQRRWKGGRYGAGQLVLLPQQDLLLVVTEKTGEIVFVKAEPTKHIELARYSAVSGKTWNHPVVAHDRLYVRNGEEAVCFALPAGAE